VLSTLISNVISNSRGAFSCPRPEQLSHLLEEMAIGWTQQTVVPQLHESVGQHVLKEAAYELFSGHRAESDLISC
jgi:hypothetical protein